MKTTLSFTGCKHLDFENNYAAKKVIISSQQKSKVCWDRPVESNSSARLVQFCGLRGRLNRADACLCEANKMCKEYEDKLHTTNI